MTKDHNTDRYWLHAQVGDLVYDVADSRHIGRVEAIHWSACRATVRWLETDTI
jgi:hypothetical protein